MTNFNTRVTIEKITFGALFAAIAIILKIFVSYETQEFAVRIFEIPIIISGILLGPLFGGFVGLVTDLVYSMVNIRGLNVGINLFTLEAILYGLIPGLFFRYLRYNIVRLSITIFITLIICFMVSSTQLYLWSYPQTAAFYAKLPFRIIILCVKIPIEIFIAKILLTNKSFSNVSIYKRFYIKHDLELDENDL